MAKKPISHKPTSHLTKRLLNLKTCVSVNKSLTMSDEYSDDEGPESVTFTQSKDSAFSAIDEIKASLKCDKETKKRLNVQREIRNIEQKKRKTLPLEVLQKAEKILEQKRKKKDIIDSNNDTKESSGDEDDYSSEDEQIKFVPIMKTKFCTKTSEDAMNFKSNHLFHGRIRRINSQQQKNLNHKLFSKNRRR
uniref:Uncharacterized protein LOC100179438 n=1 Tax=Phallusia mammillata TaxID=59560 RepID=A0A6F9DHS0_9ASCI|nr:uncharacterized protein LOC100179438 [Phallusia mammillata]